MWPILLCIAIPLFVLGLFAFLRSQYGDEIFLLEWPGHGLNRDDDHRLIKLRLNAPDPKTDAAPPMK